MKGKIKKGFAEYAGRRVPITTTIPHALNVYLHENGIKLARWIDEKMHSEEAKDSATVLHQRIDNLVKRLDEQCRERQKLEQRLKVVEGKT